MQKSRFLIFFDYYEIRFGDFAFDVRSVPSAILVLLEFSAKNNEPFPVYFSRIKDCADHIFVNALFRIRLFFYNYSYNIVFFHLFLTFYLIQLPEWLKRFFHLDIPTTPYGRQAASLFCFCPAVPLLSLFVAHDL